jgi:hypothetical protein
MRNSHKTAAHSWQTAFLKLTQRPEYGNALKEAALKAHLREWTRLLTDAVVSTCTEMHWKASARRNKLELLPISRSEYLSLDVVAFASGDKRWRFPVAVIELENGRDGDQVAYSLWKVLCVQAELRVVFCYRPTKAEGSQLVQFLRDEVVHAMDLENRTRLIGQTLVVVGERGETEAFPYGYFKWWFLEQNTSTFRLL